MERCYSRFSNSGCDFAPAFAPSKKPILGLLGSMVNAFSQQETNENNYSMAAENRAWQSNENWLNWYRQELSREGSQKWQKDFWNEQFDKENAYNSPGAQIRRLAAGGANPFAFFGQTGTAQGSSPATPIASTPSSPGMTGAPSVIPFQAPFNGANFAAGFKDFAEGIRAMADAKKAGVDTDYLEQTLDYRVAKEEAFSGLEQLKFQFTSKYGDERERWINNKIISQAQEAANNAFNLAYKGQIDRARAVFADEMAKLEKDYSYFLTGIKKQEFENWQTDFDSVLDLRSASSSQARATAHRERQQAVNLDQQYNINRPEEIISSVHAEGLLDNDLQKDVYNTFVQDIKNKYTASHIEENDLYTKLAMSIHNAKYVDYHMFLEETSRVLGVAQDVVSTVVPIGKFKALRSASESMKQRNDLKNKEIEAVDVKQTTTYNKNGKQTGFVQEKRFKNPRPKN